MWNRLTKKEINKSASGIDVSMEELIALRHSPVHDWVNNKKQWLKLAGQKLSNIRGRGIEFDATREYQAGDDIRHMAWRVTARSLKPHIKVYHEEKERPVWLAVDLSPSLYFGTRCSFKSVSSIKQAVSFGWSYLLKRERIGAIIAAQEMQVFRPQVSERNFLAILHSLSACSSQLPAYSDDNYLSDLLQTMQQHVRSDNLIFILSDFFRFDTNNQKLILHIAQRAQVVLIFVYDPFEAEPPPPHQYLLTDGLKRALFNMDNARIRQEYQQQFQTKLNDLIDFTRRNNIALQILRTDQEGLRKS